MSTIEHIIVPRESIRLLNHSDVQILVVTVDLIKVWERIKGWTDVYISVDVLIPIIALAEARTMTLRIEKTFKVEAIDPLTPIVKIETTLPYTLKTDDTKSMDGRASVMYYDIV